MHAGAQGDEDAPEIVLHFVRGEAARQLGLLNEAIDSLPSVMSDEGQPLLIRYALFQGFLINVRTMIDFLQGPQPGKRVFPGDQFARKFADGWTVADEDEVREATAHLTLEIHKQLAHMTTERMGDGKEVFPIEVSYSDDRIREIADQMVGYFNRFAEVASFEKVGERRPWHNDDGTLATAEDVARRHPQALNAQHLRATSIAAEVTEVTVADDEATPPAP